MTIHPSETFSFLQKHRLLKFIVSLGLLLALYAGAGFLVAPWVLLPEIQRQINEAINGTATIERLSINPFTLSVGAENITLNSPDGEKLLFLKNLYLNLEARSIYEGVPTFREVRLNAPQITLGRQSDGQLNFSGLFRESSDPESEDKKRGYPGVIIDQISISGGTLEYFDAQLQKRFDFELTPFKVDLRDLRSTNGSESSFEVFAKNRESNSVLLKGKLLPSPFRISGEIDLQIEEPGPLFTYLASNLNLRSPVAKMHLVSKFDFDTADKNTEIALKSTLFEISDLELQGAEDAAHLAKIKRASLDLDVSFKERFARISNLKIESGDVNLKKRADGTYNITNIVRSDAPPAESQKQEERFWSLSVSDSRLSDFTINYSDVSSSPDDFSVHKLNIDINRYSTEGSGLVSSKIDAVIAESGNFQASMSGKLNPLDLSLDLNLDKMALVSIPPTIVAGVSPQIAGGLGRVNGTLKVNGNSPAQVSFTGSAGVSDLVVHDITGLTPLLSVKAVQADEINYHSHPGSLTISNVAIFHPQLSLKFDKHGTSNYKGTAPSPADRQRPFETAQKFRIKIHDVVLDHGEFNYRDESLPSPFKTQAREINGVFSDISNTTDLSFKLTLRAKIGDQGKISYKGRVLPSSSFPLQDGELELSNLDMLSFSPYTMKYFGRAVEGGKLSAEIKNHTQDTLILGENNFVLDRFYLGNQTGQSTTSLPISSALSILRDRRGQINLSFPVSGEIKAPGYSYRKLLYKSLEDLTLSVATSPFSLLASIYNFSSEELSHIDFAPEDHKLLESELVKLELIRSALTDRPGLRLEIRGGSSISADGGDKGETSLNEELFELAADRASSIRDTILARSNIEPERIYMLAPVATELAADKTIPTFLALRSD